MKRLPLALTLLLGGAVSTASADYVLIVANLAKTTPRSAPGMPGAPGVPVAGAPGGGGQLGGGIPGVSGFGGPQPGAAQIPGAAPGVVAPPSEPFDPDKVPMMILAVIEVEKKLSKIDVLSLKLGSAMRTPVPFRVAGFDGKVLLAKTSITDVEVLWPNNKPTPPLHSVYDGKVKDLAESKTPVTAEQWADLAEWCLGHGMLPQFKLHMDKAAESDKSLPRVAGYLQMKATLTKPVDNSVDAAGTWRKQLLSSRYETRKTAHYALLSDDPPAAEERAKRIEEAFESYYYWFALHGVQLPVPTQRLVAILTKDPKTFKHLNTVLDSTPIICDSFYARRENVVVFSSRRLDDAYDRLEKLASPLWTQGFSRDLLLKGKGFPARVAPREIYDAMTLALLLKVMELDGEVAGTQHGVTRQLTYASGLLPPNVVPPEWVQFGMGSFFETSPGSPWPTVGLPNFLYGPMFKEMVAAKKLPTDPLELLKATVTDDFFRNPAPGLKKDAALRRARCTAWSLVHFLVRKRSDGLRNYFKELSQMPRDVALDENQLWRAFARAFGAVDATGEPDPKPLRDLADDWDKDMRIDQYDTREIDLMRTIRLAYQQAARSNTPPPPGANQPGAAPPPGAPGGFTPGFQRGIRPGG